MAANSAKVLVLSARTETVLGTSLLRAEAMAEFLDKLISAFHALRAMSYKN
jgi:hypothetical protein